MNEKNTAIYQGQDSLYHRRHSKRSLRRAERIAEYIQPGDEILDVGCNQGVISDCILRDSKPSSVTGVELSRDTVSKVLFDNPEFDFIEGNICDIRLDKQFDVIVYGAVHHHILRERGLSEAVRVWRSLAGRCRRHLFFETGHITEGGRWAWQRKLRCYFNTDEEHIFYMLRTIDESIRGFEVVGKYMMHGAYRWLIRIDFASEREALSAPGAESRLADLDLTSGRSYGRNFGSKNQRLLDVSEGGHDSPVRFYDVSGGNDRFFVKEARHWLLPLWQEYRIGRSLDAEWAVKAHGMMRENILVFPYVDGFKILEYDHRNDAECADLARQLLRIWAYCKKNKIPDSYPGGNLLPLEKGAVLADVIDLNPNNFIVERKGEGCCLRLVDFEPQSNHYQWKNRMHMAKILWFLGSKRGLASAYWCAGLLQGVVHLAQFEFASVERRIKYRQPSLTSLCVATLRSLGGRALVRMVPQLNEL
ncbi:MAG: class I SAM-dependent methyltransferase [Candidatus Sedimenticola endophacoides]